MLSNAVKEQFASTRPVCHTLKVSPWSLKFVDSQKMKFQILLPNRSRERCSGAFCFKFTRSQVRLVNATPLKRHSLNIIYIMRTFGFELVDQHARILSHRAGYYAQMLASSLRSSEPLRDSAFLHACTCCCGQSLRFRHVPWGFKHQRLPCTAYGNRMVT